MRIPWDEQEAAILLDALVQYLGGKVKFKDAVTTVSEFLRKRATDKGMQIDDKFRNTNGIALQLQHMLHDFTGGEQGVRNSSKLFRDIIDL